jgi:hypothetical protein
VGGASLENKFDHRLHLLASVGWTPEFDNDRLFRAIEYGAM